MSRKKKSRGWPNEPIRHKLAGMGIETVIDGDKRFDVSKFVARGAEEERIKEVSAQMEVADNITWEAERLKDFYDQMARVRDGYGLLPLQYDSWEEYERDSREMHEHRVRKRIRNLKNLQSDMWDSAYREKIDTLIKKLVESEDVDVSHSIADKIENTAWEYYDYLENEV